MNSTRLPGKSLRPVGSHPLIWWVVTRTLATKGLDDIICATTSKPEDDELATYVTRQLGIRCYRGSEENVLNRMVTAGMTCNADVLVRVTADDPFKDPAVMGLAISTFLEQPNIDLCQNVSPRTCPVGVDVEVLSLSALKRAELLVKSAKDREHVTSYFYNHPQDFEIMNFGLAIKSHQGVRLTIDTHKDLVSMSLLAAKHRENPLVSYVTLAREMVVESNATLFPE